MSLKQSIANDNLTGEQRRRYPRRAGDVCMITVNNRAYPVVDWSLCGVLFEADTRLFSEGETVPMILRFKIQNGIEDVKVLGKVVRKNMQAVATEFTDVPDGTFETLEHVITVNDKR